MWSRRTILISRSGKCEMALGLFKPYAGAQLWSQAVIASSLSTPHLSAERPNYSSTFNCTRHKELPVSKPLVLDLLPPRAAHYFGCCPVSVLCRTLTTSICPSCWIWGFGFILLLRVREWPPCAYQSILPLASSKAEKDWPPTHSWASPSDWAQ